MAADTMLELLSDDDPKVRLSAARTLLDKIEPVEQSGWGIGETSAQALIEAEYIRHQQKQLFGGDTIIGGGISDSVKEAIAEIIRNKDEKYSNMKNDDSEGES